MGSTLHGHVSMILIAMQISGTIHIASRHLSIQRDRYNKRVM